MSFVCLIAALICTTLLVTTLADEAATDEAVTPGTEVEEEEEFFSKWFALPQERSEYCLNLIRLGSNCPVDSFPLVSPFNPYLFSESEEDLKTLFEALSHAGVEKTCKEFQNYLDCLGNTSANGMKQCGQDGGRGFAYLSAVLYQATRPSVQTGMKLCTEHLNLLSEHFACLTNYELFIGIRDCAEKSDDSTAALQCINDEINKTEDCKEGAGDLLKEIFETLNEELRVADELVAKF